MAVAAGTILRAVAEVIMPSSTVAQNVFYLQFDDDGTSNSDQDVVDDIVEWLDIVYTSFKGKVSDTVLPGEVKVYKWDTVGLDWDEVGSNSLVTVFSGTDQMLPHGVAPVITGRTSDPDVNGRKFLPGFAEDTCNASALTGATISALLITAALWVTDFTGTLTGSNFNPGVWSVVQVAFKAFVDHIIVNGIIGYQRRRKPGVGI